MIDEEAMPTTRRTTADSNFIAAIRFIQQSCWLATKMKFFFKLMRRALAIKQSQSVGEGYV